MEHRAKIVAIALLSLGVAFSSEALTLGRVRGAVLIGQPLDVVVPVQMDAGEDASLLCFDADVFHADARQDAGRVRVVVEPGAQPHLANLRVLSSAVVDEPVVTVYLRTGCGQKTTRRYVLLADLPSEVAAPAAPLAVQAPAPATPTQRRVPTTLGIPPVATASAVNAKTTPVSKQAARREADNRRTKIQAALAAPNSRMVDEKSKAVRPAGQSRLKLDPLELLSDRVANVDSYMTFAPPEDALRNIQKVQTLEADVKSLLALVAKNETSLVDLRARLRTAETQRFSGGVIYGLIALVLLCLTAVALLWSRQRRARVGGDDWWSGSIATPGPATSETNPVPLPEPLAARQKLNKVPSSGKPDAAPLSGFFNESWRSQGVDVNLTEMRDSNFNDFMRSGGAPNADRKPPRAPLAAGALQARPVHSLNAEAALDIRQQAEILVSLGQTDRAARILKKQIRESDDPSPLVYLDLFSIFHALGMKIEFQQLREEFNRLFSGRVPEFASFKEEGRDLESYTDVLSRITALWPAPKVLEVIESCIVPDSRGGGRQSFDLAAFRDLLLLRAVAQSVVPVPDLSLDEIQPSRVLDLDLSNLDFQGLGSNPASIAEVDLPLIMPGDDEVDAQGADPTRPLEPWK